MDPNWRDIPSLSSLRAFELTARSGNFASAARELNVTHAAIAQKVRSLEGDLGVSLVRRSGRSVALTDAGTRLARHLTEGFGTIADGIAELRASQSEQPVQVATTVHISQAIILPKLHEFWQAHPDVRVSVTPSQDVLDIAALGFDLAIRATSGKPDWPGLNAEPLLECELVAVGAPSLVTDDMPPIDELPWIWSKGVEFEERNIQAFGLDTSTLKNVDIGVPFLQISLARQGLGLSFAAEILVRNELKSGELRRVPVPSPYSITYYAVTPEGPIRPQAEVFVEWLKRTLAKRV